MTTSDFIQAFTPRADEYVVKKYAVSVLLPGGIKEQNKKNVSTGMDTLRPLIEKIDKDEFNAIVEKYCQGYINRAINNKYNKAIAINYEDNVRHYVSGKDYKTIRSNQYEGTGFYPLININTKIRELELTTESVAFIDDHFVDLIKYEHYSQHKSTSKSCFRFPVDHLMFSRYNKTMLSLSVDAYVFEKEGYTVRSMSKIVLDRPHAVVFKKWEVEMMIKYYKYINQEVFGPVPYNLFF